MNIFRIATIVLGLGLGLQLVAQPPRRRAEQQQKEAQAPSAPRGSAYREFPTAQAMPGDVAWRRDLYRTIDLTKE